jgi:hypothetical protein
MNKRETYRTNGLDVFKMKDMDIYDYWTWKYPRIEDPVMREILWNQFAHKASKDVYRELIKPQGLIKKPLD